MNEESPGHYADLAAGFAAGSRLGGYRLEEQVGAGGMAVVYRARDERLDRLVALKIMTPAMGSDDMFRQRFIRESRAAAAVDDPHIIPVYEAGEAGHILFIAMRFVRGGDVRSLLRREGPLPPERVVSIISPVASALDAAHAVGLVHRDVKPANILLDRRPGRPDHVYLSDFGLSKSAEVSLGLTAAGQFLGTPDYTAPEQIEGLPVDGRTDQYALACAVFELLTGQAPFHRSESFASIWAHLNKPPPSLRQRRTELPPAVDLVMTKALAKAQVDRYGTCWEFAEALREALSLASYHVGPASDPGLGPAGSTGREAHPGQEDRPAQEAGPGQRAGPGVVPSPGEDTEASEIYAARAPAAHRDQGRPARDSQASIPDEQATDPGVQVIDPGVQVVPPDPASVQADEPGGPRPPASPPAGEAREPALEPAGARAPAAEPSGPPVPEPASPLVPEPASAPPPQPPRIPVPEPAGPRGQELAPPPVQDPPAAPAQPRVPPRRPAAPGSWPGIPRSRPGSTRNRPAAPRQPPGTPPPPPGAPGRPAGQAQRRRAPRRRRAALLTLTGAGILVAVALTLVLTFHYLGLRGGRRTASASGFSSLGFVPPPPGTLSSVAFSPDGKTLAAGATADPKAGPKTGPRANGITYLWDVKTGSQLRTFSPGGGAEAFSPDGTTLATAGGPGNSSTYLWDVATGRKIGTLTDHQHSRIKSVAFSASGGMLAVNDANGTVYVWNLPGRRGTASIHAVLSLQGFVNSDAVAFSPQGATLFMGGSDGQAYLWNAATGNTRTLAAPGASEITSVAYSPDGQALAAGDTGGVTYVWNLAAGSGDTLPDPDSMGIESVAFGPGSKWLATGDTNGNTYVWHLPAAKPVKTLTNPTRASVPLRAAVFSVAFSPRGTLATIDTDGHAYLWKVR